jgi:hypothetical protein
MTAKAKDDILTTFDPLSQQEGPPEHVAAFIEEAKHFIAAHGIAEQAEAFTAYAVDIFAQEIPDAKISIVHPLVLRIGECEDSGTVPLIHHYKYAARNPDDREAALRWSACSLAKTRAVTMDHAAAFSFSEGEMAVLQMVMQAHRKTMPGMIEALLEAGVRLDAEAIDRRAMASCLAMYSMIAQIEDSKLQSEILNVLQQEVAADATEPLPSKPTIN